MHGGGMIMLPRFVGVVLFLLAATAFVQPSLANVESLPSQDIITDLSVDCTSRNMDINNAIGQTFFPQSFGILHKISIWIKPDIYDITSYELQVYTGVFDTLLETSTEISINELEPASWEIHTAGLAQYYDFTFASSEVLIQGEMYSWKLVRTSEYSGTFARCGNIIEGQGYWLGTSPESGGNDYAFKLMVHPVSMPSGVPSSSPSSARLSEMMNPTGTGSISSSPTSEEEETEKNDGGGGDDTTNSNTPNSFRSTVRPLVSPSSSPSSAPTRSPVTDPSSAPTRSPVTDASSAPTRSPVTDPSSAPTRSPVTHPSSDPTRSPVTDASSAPTRSTLTIVAATAFVQPSLANVESLPSQDIITDLSVDCTSRNVDINNAIGQTFFPQSFGILHKIAIWIKPDIYDITSYELQVYTGVFDTLLETSTEISINELEPASWEFHTAGLAQYYNFTFASSEVLIQGEMYSWKLVRTSEYSGTFARCGNIIEGQGYLLGTSPESGGNDYAFKLMVHPVSMPIGVPSSSPSSASPSEMMNFTGTGTISSSPTGDDTTNPNAKNVTSGAATVWYSSYAHFTTMLAGLAVSIILSGATFAA